MSAVACGLGRLFVLINQCAFPPVKGFGYRAFGIHRLFLSDALSCREASRHGTTMSRKLGAFSPEAGCQSASNDGSDDAYPHGNVDPVN